MTTPNYGMFLPTDDNLMSDVDGSFNNSWSIIESSAAPTVVASLPITDFSYPIGSKIYHSVLQSVFVLVASNAAWGNFWQPIQTHYGPWIQPGNSIIADLVTYKFTTSPIGYRLTNTGKFIFRGSVDTVAATGYIDFETTAAPVGLNSIPPAIAPNKKAYFSGAPYPQASSLTKPAVGQLAVTPSGVFSNGVWNPANNATQLFYDGWEWSMGYYNGYGPNN